ncbi:CGNR zinc finger domain-containing protein [Streptomyces sp. ADI93-02]|uniref:CGNR zinc finger domain-containing protein n=1 Tax=unclassified Streptomyces TaxID=2593676 RepID=UPI000F550324|nr:CGNR zinc finger domain-containing protein [Streptomyces sp. ADI93-02]RPK42769.1 CGNR zinc finger [Streptomyces sp. ADI93-02]
MERWAALELASTIRHDGEGGVTDDLATAQGLEDWIARHRALLDDHVPAYGGTVDEDLRLRVVEVRRAVRALFARAVSPARPSPPDAHRLMPADRAVAHLNATAALVPVVPRLDWPPEGPPVTRLSATRDDPHPVLLAALARAAVDFLGGPQRDRLRACTAPRCVRYFVKGHGRQEWCRPACGNRARAARHYDRHHRTQGTQSGT